MSKNASTCFVERMRCVWGSRGRVSGVVVVDRREGGEGGCAAAMAQKGQVGELGRAGLAGLAGLVDDLARLEDAGGQIVAGGAIIGGKGIVMSGGEYVQFSLFFFYTLAIDIQIA